MRERGGVLNSIRNTPMTTLVRLTCEGYAGFPAAAHRYELHEGQLILDPREIWPRRLTA